jgi:4-aminobenzoate N-oxygenase
MMALLFSPNSPITDEHHHELGSAGWTTIAGVAGLAEVPGVLAAFGETMPQYDGQLVHEVKARPEYEGLRFSKSANEIGPHTEALVLDPPPRYLALYCVAQARCGDGHTALADGFAFLDGLEPELRAAARRPVELTMTTAPAGHVQACARHPLEELRPDGARIFRFSHNAFFFGDLHPPAGIEVAGAAPHLPAEVRRLAERGTEFFERDRIKVLLAERSLLVWDNHRMFHARSCYRDRRRHLVRFWLRERAPREARPDSVPGRGRSSPGPMSEPVSRKPKGRLAPRGSRMHFPHEIENRAVERLGAGWSKRATVRLRENPCDVAGDFDPALPDYPIEMVPFRDHPRFLAASETQRQAVLTWAWIVYNERTITAEDRVANPAFALLMQDYFPGADTFAFKNTIQQSLVDEHYHTLMHRNAVHRTRLHRGLTARIRFPHSITYRRLLEAQAGAAEQWERDLLTLTFAIVSEISINAYLDLLADAADIQPLHSMIAGLHGRDEHAHEFLLGEVAKAVYARMNAAQRRCFLGALPVALEAFVSHDFSAWARILEHAGIDGAAEIIADCERDTSRRSLTRDYTGLQKLARELDVVEQLDFDFTGTVHSAPRGAP